VNGWRKKGLNKLCSILEGVYEKKRVFNIKVL